ncbi:MAG TPA: L-threonylcarbamoyladenylate synthase [Actinomycetota bacterium]|nr:L-threonylcarbamoyladenylate synthase [Actinomycetota bacterium]
MGTMSGPADAVDALDAGGVIVIPTDTVYGLAARPTLPDAVKRIFEVKERPDERALPVLGGSIDPLREVALLDEVALRLAERFWPGPLSLVLPRAAGFDHPLGGTDDGTVAVRIPAFDATLDLLTHTGPLAVTSANRSGAPPAVTVDEARAALGDAIDVFIDGGRVGGAPSTVVTLVGPPRVLRAGALAAEAIEEVLGAPLA